MEKTLILLLVLLFLTLLLFTKTCLMNKHHICEHTYMKPGITKKAFFETKGLGH